MAANITDADAVIALTITNLLPTAVNIQGFAMDDVFSTANVAPTEVMMGVDGGLSGGYVPREKKVTIVLMAASPSNAIFDTWAAGQDAAFTALLGQMQITLPSLGTSWACNNGFLTGYEPTPAAKKIAQPRRFEITFESIVPAPVGAAG